MGRELAITGHTELIGLVATPIRHSMSPQMHNAAFDALGLDYVYLVFEVGKEELKDKAHGNPANQAWEIQCTTEEFSSFCRETQNAGKQQCDGDLYKRANQIEDAQL